MAGKGQGGQRRGREGAGSALSKSLAPNYFPN